MGDAFEADDFKVVIIDGKKWEEMGPYCQICGAHMGELYDPEEGKFENPYNYDEYGHNKCPKCSQEYEYAEGNSAVFSEDQLKLLRKHAGLEKE